MWALHATASPNADVLRPKFYENNKHDTRRVEDTFYSGVLPEILDSKFDWDKIFRKFETSFQIH